jgi:hypothetical protein
VTIRRHTIRAEVSDSGPGFTPTRLFAARDVGGLGLVIVNRCAARWGTTHHGQRVWFELDRAASTAAGGIASGSRSGAERAPATLTSRATQATPATLTSRSNQESGAPRTSRTPPAQTSAL